MPLLNFVHGVAPAPALRHLRQEQVAAAILILGIALIGLILVVEWVLNPAARGTFPSA